MTSHGIWVISPMRTGREAGGICFHGRGREVDRGRRENAFGRDLEREREGIIAFYE